MVRRKDLKDGVFATADLIREDREKKAEYRDRMKAAYNEASCTLMGVLLPRALYFSAKSINIFCQRYNRYNHFEIFIFQIL